ncbi:MAG TPA: hypothetical protein VGZ47_20225 [Gemmataceae bacterium]|jgi:hypothetical protein|nr:hypothetical protein [Gemmataceae bacterium]
MKKAFVLYDLHVFEKEYLPALLAHARPARRADGTVICHPLSLAAWQAAVGRLRLAVIEGKESLDPKEFEPCATGLPLNLPREPTDHFELSDPTKLLMPPYSYSASEGRLRWNLYPVIFAWTGSTPAERARWLLNLVRGAGSDGPKDAEAELRKRLPEIASWFTELAPRDMRKIGGYYDILPIIADIDPAFALHAVDAQNDSRLPDANPFYPDCICAGLAAIMQTFANNSFTSIGALLKVPDVHASYFWNAMMQGVVFDVLFLKAAILGEITRGLE